MLERPARDEVMTAAPLTPWRPPLFFAGIALTMVALVALAALALSPDGFGAVDVLLLALFAMTLPWYVIGFWNASIGLVLMRFASDPVAAVMPAAGRVGFIREGFADRRFRPDGSLVPRNQPDAFIETPEEAVKQALTLVDAGVQSLCVHGDNPQAVVFVKELRAALLAAGFTIAPFHVRDEAPP